MRRFESTSALVDFRPATLEPVAEFDAERHVSLESLAIGDDSFAFQYATASLGLRHWFRPPHEAHLFVAFQDLHGFSTCPSAVPISAVPREPLAGIVRLHRLLSLHARGAERFPLVFGFVLGTALNAVSEVQH